MTDPTLSQSIEEILKKAEVLRNAVPEIMSYVSPDDVMEQNILRDEFRNDIQRVNDHIADKIGELNAIRRKLRQAKADMALDNEKLEAYRWQLIRSQPK